MIVPLAVFSISLYSIALMVSGHIFSLHILTGTVLCCTIFLFFMKIFTFVNCRLCMTFNEKKMKTKSRFRTQRDWWFAFSSNNEIVRVWNKWNWVVSRHYTIWIRLSKTFCYRSLYLPGFLSICSTCHIWKKWNNIEVKGSCLPFRDVNKCLSKYF